jgi:hypothetical protein
MLLFVHGIYHNWRVLKTAVTTRVMGVMKVILVEITEVDKCCRNKHLK